VARKEFEKLIFEGRPLEAEREFRNLEFEGRVGRKNWISGKRM
jgi:hypothetical protein